jgi:hypothetical protein
MPYARNVDGAWIEVAAAFTVGVGDDAIQYPPMWLEAITAKERADLGAVEIVEEPPVAAPLQLLGQELVDVGGVPHRRWVLPPAADVRAACRAQLAAIRWDRQQTMKWRGRVVASDDTTTGRIMAAVMRAQITGDQAATVQWKFGDADFDTLTVADLTAYGMAIGAHLQGCYDREAELVAAIGAAGDATAVAAIDLGAGWPA